MNFSIEQEATVYNYHNYLLERFSNFSAHDTLTKNDQIFFEIFQKQSILKIF
jgi:hypothetical protein